MVERKKTKTKAKTKAKAKAKPVPVLTKAEEFYIEQNSNKTDTELAIDLGKPIQAITSHIHNTQGASRVNKLLIREKGCVIMTEGASMASDASQKGYVSEQAVREAVNRGDYEEASRLQKIIKQQRNSDSDAAREKASEYIHYTKKG